MNNLHMPSVLKAGGAAAGIAVVLMLLSVIPVLGEIIGICFLCGGFLIPVVGGMAYGYFAPGEEDMGQSAIGGALSGGVGGILLGVFFALSGAVSSAVQSGLGDAVAAGALGTVMCSGILGVMGFVLGAVGGVVWPAIQNQFGN